MGKKLAIRGHSTRGNEVIKLLEILDGHNGSNLLGNKSDYVYFITDSDDIGCRDTNHILIDYFTIEEFLEKFPFKVGDVIKFPNNMAEEIAEMKWDEELEDIVYTSVSGCTRTCQVLKNTNNKANTNMNENKVESTGFMQIGKTVTVCFNTENYEDEVELQLGNYEIVVRDGKTYAVKKKPKYPATYKECRAILNYMVGCMSGYKSSLLASLQSLLICRDAYWKIAGEQMGLGKPWKPDWNDLNRKYFISLTCDGIGLYDDFRNPQVLAFPTKEMRDAFYENFKDLIEQCKELL